MTCNFLLFLFLNLKKTLRSKNLMIKSLFFSDKNHLGVPLQIGQGMTPPLSPLWKYIKLLFQSMHNNILTIIYVAVVRTNEYMQDECKWILNCKRFEYQGLNKVIKQFLILCFEKWFMQSNLFVCSLKQTTLSMIIPIRCTVHTSATLKYTVHKLH